MLTTRRELEEGEGMSLPYSDLAMNILAVLLVWTGLEAPRWVESEELVVVEREMWLAVRGWVSEQAEG